MRTAVINPVDGALDIDELSNPIKLISVADFNPDDYPEPGFFWKDVLPFGTINLLAGPTGVGKTSFALQLSSWGLFSNGGDFFSKLDAVLYADLETRPRELIPLNSQIDQFRPLNFFIAHVEAPSNKLPANTRFLSYTEGLVKQLQHFFTLNPTGKILIVIDNIQTLLSGLELEKISVLSQFRATLQPFVTDERCFLIINHTKKTEKLYFSENEIFGSSYLTNVATTILGINSIGGDLIGIWEIKNRYRKKSSVPYILRHTNIEYRADFEFIAVPEGARQLHPERILQIFFAKDLKEKGVIWSTITKIVGVSRRTIENSAKLIGVELPKEEFKGKRKEVNTENQEQLIENQQVK
jgi:hypothetical protein